MAVSGCISDLTDESGARVSLSTDKSRKIAREYVMSLPEYRDYQGRNFTLIEEIPFDCPSCCTIGYTFEMQSMKDPVVVDGGTVRVSLRDGRVIGVVAPYGKNE